MRTNSLAIRLVAMAAILGAVALLIIGFILSNVFEQTIEESLDDRLIALMDSLVSVSEVSDEGEVTLSREVAEPQADQAFSGWYWQINRGDKPMLRSRSLWDQSLDYTAIPEEGEVVRLRDTGPADEDLRILTRTIWLPGADEPLVFIAAADRSELVERVDDFLTTLVLAMSLFGVGILTAIFIQVRFGLLPLRRIAAALSDIRVGRTERLAGEFPSEIEPLAGELNVLLDHNAKVLERSRTQVGNLAHALKTPLSVLTNDAGKREGEFAESVSEQARVMHRQIDNYLARARTAGRVDALGADTAVAPLIDKLTRTLGRMHLEKGVVIEADVPANLMFRGESEDLEEILGNLLDNAFKWAKERAGISASLVDEMIEIRVEDDGPGLPEEMRDQVVGRGFRLDESKPGSGLGLSIVCDIIEIYGGRLELDQSDLGGLKATVTIPGAALDAA